VLLVHPGGPFWARRDDGAWTIPKGEFGADESPADAARREFREELGADVVGDLAPLPPVRQAGGKEVHAFLVRGDFDPEALVSNRFTLEWPPRSGRFRSFPEVDRAAWFGLAQAQRKLNPAQCSWLAAVSTLVRQDDDNV
jgi:predicted NUDIX family NTP pyrophosphohydrolase